MKAHPHFLGMLALAWVFPGHAALPTSSPADFGYHGRMTAAGHARRIDVVWEPSAGVNGWNVWRESQANGPFERLNDRPQTHTVYSDFLGEDGATYFYRLSGVSGGTEVSPRQW